MSAIDTPWVEKYRPQKLADVVLDEHNQQMFTAILETGRFPNLLFYGPPGTGKTTTIINLVREYQSRHHATGKGLTMHLNASDDRGIEVMRTQILQFVSAEPVFGEGLKFVVLDEVDAMTKNAQVALRHVVQQFSNNVRFCLICNYISRIDTALQSMLVLARFNNIPQTDVRGFLMAVAESENVECDDVHFDHIMQCYGSDVRSMINALQLFAHTPTNTKSVTDEDVALLYTNVLNTSHDSSLLRRELRTLCEERNSHVRDIISHLLDWITRTRTVKLRGTPHALSFFVTAAHPSNQESPYHSMNTLLQLREFQL